MSDLTDAFEQLVTEWAFNNEDMPTAHTDLYVALHTGDPNDDGDPNTEPGNENEVDAEDYERANVGATSSNWTIDTTSQQGTAVVNDTDIPFGIAGNNWGTVTHVSLWTGPQDDTDAIPLAATSVDSSSEITTNDQVRYPSGVIDFNLD